MRTGAIAVVDSNGDGLSWLADNSHSDALSNTMVWGSVSRLWEACIYVVFFLHNKANRSFVHSFQTKS